jgi:hypothetical protein
MPPSLPNPFSFALSPGARASGGGIGRGTSWRVDWRERLLAEAGAVPLAGWAGCLRLLVSLIAGDRDIFFVVAVVVEVEVEVGLVRRLVPVLLLLVKRKRFCREGTTIGPSSGCRSSRGTARSVNSAKVI